VSNEESLLATVAHGPHAHGQEHDRRAIFACCLRGQSYGLRHSEDVTLLPWTQRYAAPGPVPGVPSWMLGLLSVQGTVQAIVDLGAFLGLGMATPDDETRLVFLRRDDIYVGLLVDASSVVRYLDDPLSPTPVSSPAPAPREFGSPLVVAVARVEGEDVRVLDGGALLDALVRALDPLEVAGVAIATTVTSSGVTDALAATLTPNPWLTGSSNPSRGFDGPARLPDRGRGEHGQPSPPAHADPSLGSAEPTAQPALPTAGEGSKGHDPRTGALARPALTVRGHNGSHNGGHSAGSETTDA